jgi:hypothetical protein
MSALGLALAGLLALSSGQEPKAAEPPRRAPVVGEVELKDYIEQRAKVISLEAQIKDCHERLERRHFLVRFLRLLFARR